MVSIEKCMHICDVNIQVAIFVMLKEFPFLAKLVADFLNVQGQLLRPFYSPTTTYQCIIAPP